MAADSYLEVKRTVDTVFLRPEDGRKMFGHSGKAAEILAAIETPRAQADLKYTTTGPAPSDLTNTAPRKQ